MLDTNVVKEGAKTLADLFLYRPNGDYDPLDMVATADDDKSTQDGCSQDESETEDSGGAEIVDALR